MQVKKISKQKKSQKYLHSQNVFFGWHLIPRSPDEAEKARIILSNEQFKKEEIGAGKRGTRLSVQPMKINVCYNKKNAQCFYKNQILYLKF